MDSVEFAEKMDTIEGVVMWVVVPNEKGYIDITVLHKRSNKRLRDMTSRKVSWWAFLVFGKAVYVHVVKYRPRKGGH